MKRYRIGILVAIAVGVMGLITFIFAPTQATIQQGSTYSRAPSGYGAWYAYMQQQGVSIQRWQKPFTALDQHPHPITLLQVYPRAPRWHNIPQKWVEQGNTLLILGKWEPVSDAPFTTLHQSDFGTIKIDTRRRKRKIGTPLLADQYGAIVWQEFLGKGSVIYALTPYLGANAYQNDAGNYPFLANLITQSGNSIFIDEYLHGYKDEATITEEVGDNILSYLSKTPLFPLSVALLLLLMIAIWGNNRRFGQPMSLTSPTVNNSQAYIEALASVLQKANSSNFVISLITEDERRQLAQKFGLPDNYAHDSTLVNLWQQQTGQSPESLRSLLSQSSSTGQMNDRQLQTWLEKWQKMRQSRTGDSQQGG